MKYEMFTSNSFIKMTQLLSVFYLTQINLRFQNFSALPNSSKISMKPTFQYLGKRQSYNDIGK